MKRVKKKWKYEIWQKQKHDEKEKKKKVTTKESYTESNLEKKYVELEPERNEIIQHTENDDQKWKENEKDQRDVELTGKREKEYMIRTMNIKKRVKGNLRQNGKKEDAEKRSRDNLKCKELKRN